MRKQRVTVLGSTGSIGKNTLDVLARHADRFEVYALSGHSNDELMAEQVLLCAPKRVVMTDPQAARRLQERLRASGAFPQIDTAPQAMESIASDPEVDAVMAAIVGAVGLPPSLAAARAGKRLLLANKEAVVLGGSLFMQAVKQGGAQLLPIDSEHSAVFQSLPEDQRTWARRVNKIILTASGGPFRKRDVTTLHTVTPEEAVAHPNWRMGEKISVDSATMMNKALEVIEAHYLFGMPGKAIDVVIHPQSIVHSMVQFHDSSVVAQLGTADMRVPIAYGLSWPERVVSGAQTLDFSKLSAMTFEIPERSRFPGLFLAWEAIAAPPGTCAVLNAANEVAVAAFLKRAIRFDQIHRVNADTLARVLPTEPRSLADLLALDQDSRRAASETVKALQC